MHEFENVALRLAPESSEKIRRANWAVLEAISSFKGHEAEQSPALLGMSEGSFRHVVALPVVERQRLGNTAIPIWLTCIDVVFDRAAPNEVVEVRVEGADALEELSVTATGISLAEIRKANRAILDAVLSFRGRDDPAATFLLGLPQKRLEALHRLNSRDVQKVCLGNIPFWRARFEIGANGGGDDAVRMGLGRDRLMRTLMKELSNS